MNHVKRGKLEYLTAKSIAVPHCFTTRLGGVSSGYLSSMNLGIHRGDSLSNVEQNYEILADALGFAPEKLVTPRQIHSATVRAVTSEDCGKYLIDGASPECDALVTNVPGVALVVFTADCTPILIHDPVTGAVGAVHAGWRGTAAGIAAKAVKEMAQLYGCDPANMYAAIGPNIGACCFQTDGDVPKAMVESLGEAALPCIYQENEKYRVDLKQINALWLERAGVQNVEISNLCTACRQDLFWSHRRVGQQRGSQGAIIVCEGGAK